MNKSFNPFDGNLAITPEGKALRESIKVEDVLLCRNEEEEEINSLLADTMAFISNDLPKEESSICQNIADTAEQK